MISKRIKRKNLKIKKINERKRNWLYFASFFFII